MGKDKNQRGWEIMGAASGHALETLTGVPVKDFTNAARQVMDNPAPPQPTPEQEPGLAARAGKALDTAGNAVTDAIKTNLSEDPLKGAKEQYQKAFDARNNPAP